MNQTKKAKWIKGILFLVVIAIAIAMIIYLAPIMKQISTQEGQTLFLIKWKVKMMIIFHSYQFAQIFLIILPGEPLEILAGMCYGSIWGTVFVMVSAGIITTAMVFLVRKLRKKLCVHFLQ